MVSLKPSDTKSDFLQNALKEFDLESPANENKYTISLWSDNKQNTELRDKTPYEFYKKIILVNSHLKFHVHRKRIQNNTKETRRSYYDPSSSLLGPTMEDHKGTEKPIPKTFVRPFKIDIIKRVAFPRNPILPRDPPSLPSLSLSSHVKLISSSHTTPIIGKQLPRLQKSHTIDDDATTSKFSKRNTMNNLTTHTNIKPQSKDDSTPVLDVEKPKRSVPRSITMASESKVKIGRNKEV
eukprot:TRINITY_DN553_c0_g2_i3.p1 TRINITY_DN553_c0_g2~~TRINITY_DN553_c0_g2_i3.p1  ORF type:complete len:238 (-),score=42.08 TRINITY_DN553_c0_g2_i3:482-1195(-)